MKTEQKQRLCDYCNDSTAVLYCRADSAKLCLSCDREVHTTNQLFSKHSRSQLCDDCDQSPASIFCETEQYALCQNCDWQKHKELSLSSVAAAHNRRTIEGFSGCPTVGELMAIVGVEELRNKSLFWSEEEGDGLVNFGDGLSDLLVWESPGFVSLDDLIVATDSTHNYQAMEVPPLPKNRNATCGQHKEEMLRQLRELAKLEPNLKYENVDVKPIYEFQSLANEQNMPAENMHAGFENDAKSVSVPAYEATMLHWFSDSCEVANQDCFASTCGEENSVVPDKQLDLGCDKSQFVDDQGGQSQHPITARTVSRLPKAAQHEPNSQDRDSAISRYKEKKKTRRYDKHVRYESRKVRAEGRTRIKGRFAKMDH